MYKRQESAEDLAETGKAAADSQQDLADGIAKAGKAAKRNLQSFDEVHLLEDSMASDTPDFDFGFDFEDFAMPTMADAFGGITDTLANAAETAAIAWESATSRIGGAWQSLKAWANDTFPWLKPVVERVNEAVQWIKDNWPADVYKRQRQSRRSLILRFRLRVQGASQGLLQHRSWLSQALSALLE